MPHELFVTFFVRFLNLMTFLYNVVLRCALFFGWKKPKNTKNLQQLWSKHVRGKLKVNYWNLNRDNQLFGHEVSIQSWLFWIFHLNITKSCTDFAKKVYKQQLIDMPFLLIKNRRSKFIFKSTKCTKLLIINVFSTCSHLFCLFNSRKM